jgi:predicted transcriptional regulator
MQVNEQNLKHILNNLVSCVVKKDDAPASSQQHLMDAIADLSEMLPLYQIEDWEMNSVIKQAQFLKNLLTGKISEHQNIKQEKNEKRNVLSR